MICGFREEWEWLKRQSVRHKTLGCSSSETLNSASGDEQTGSEDGQSDVCGVGTEQQRVFVEHVAATARRLFSYMEVGPQEALTHRYMLLTSQELASLYAIRQYIVSSIGK